MTVRRSCSQSSFLRAPPDRARRADRWASALEAALAGVGAPLVLASSGIEIGSIAVGLVAAALGAALLLGGKRLRLYA